MPHPLASAMDGLAKTCDARGWRLAISYDTRYGSKAWGAALDKNGFSGDRLVAEGATMEEALTALWTDTQRHCRALASRGRG